MTHINIKISKAVATAEKDGIITTGMVGVPVSFMFDSWWDGLIVTAVFKGSGAPISVPLLGATETVVPWEVLKRPSTLLRIGAEGRLPDGTLVIPTTWATVGIVMSGANATDDLAEPPTPTAFDRIMSQIGNMNDLATEDKSSLVAAVNEAMEKGGGVDVSGASVGQIIKVAAVDDTGKPTKWETVDFPEPVQSDWEQNDDSCADFVKNRPFYAYDTKFECYHAQEITFNEEGIAGSLSESDSGYYLSGGDTITVIVDGVSYSGKAYNSGPPIYEIWWKASPFSYDFRGVSCSDSSFYGKTVKIQIFKVETSIVKMDKQFLPPISVNDLDDFPETVGKKTKDGGETFNETLVSGNLAHAEGYYSEAPGWYSHSEGTSTIARGENSHSEGKHTIARGENSHVQGKYNIEDGVNKYAHIVGNGTDDDKRSNAHTLDWDGNAWFAGKVKVGGTGQDDIAAKTLATTEDIPVVDGTLTQSGQAADAAAVGGRLSKLSEEIANLQTSGLTTAQVKALDGMFKVAAYIKADVSSEYSTFKTAFGIEEATITGISATYSGGNVTAGTSVDELTGIVVTAHYSDGTSQTVTGYTLSGAIAEGENTVTVTYQGKTATFTVTGVAESGGDESNDTTVQIETYDAGLNSSGATVGRAGLGVTKLYKFTTVRDNLPTKYEYLVGICPYTDEAVNSSNGYGALYIDGVFQTYSTFYGNGKPLTTTQTEGKMNINTDDGAYNGVRVPVAYANADDCYLYVKSTGQVLFAGKNTPYYNMANIDGTPYTP